MPPECEAPAFADDADCDISNIHRNIVGGPSQLPPRSTSGLPPSDPWHYPKSRPTVWLWWHLHQLSQYPLLSQFTLLEIKQERMKQGGKSSSSSSLSMEEEDEEIPQQDLSDQMRTVEEK